MIISVLSGCSSEGESGMQMSIPEDNRMTKDRVSLGEALFNDNLLSPDSSVSCSTCHKPELAFADSVAISTGNFGHSGFRNSPTLLNVGYYEIFFAEGGLKELERAVIPPMMDENEMGQDLRITLQRLNSRKYYRDKFKQAYDVDTIKHRQLVGALASYLRSLTSFNSRWDKYSNGEIEDQRLKNGEAIFNRLQCSSCHIPPLFIDNKTHNIGLDSGIPEYKDWGRGRLTLDSADFGAFKTPTLRNIVKTAPYMHDGRFQTLEEVIDFYASGGISNGVKSNKIEAFSISSSEKSDLLYFLFALTGEEYSE